eukprot:SAG22_NODE_477_length_9978_cov_2.807268_10_plen_151_part_00
MITAFKREDRCLTRCRSGGMSKLTAARPLACAFPGRDAKPGQQLAGKTPGELVSKSAVPAQRTAISSPSSPTVIGTSTVTRNVSYRIESSAAVYAASVGTDALASSASCEKSVVTRLLFSRSQWTAVSSRSTLRQVSSRSWNMAAASFPG